jgi:hypothetical protein
LLAILLLGATLLLFRASLVSALMCSIRRQSPSPTLGAAIAATGLLSMAPSSLRSPEKIVYLSMDTAAAAMPGGGVPKRRELANGKNAYPTTKRKKHTW